MILIIFFLFYWSCTGMMLKIKRRWKKRSWFFINSSALAGVFLIQFSYVILRAGNISVTFGHVRESVSEIFCLFSWFLIFEKKIKWMCSKLTNRWADWVPVREWPNRVAIIRWRRKWVSIRLPISIWVSSIRHRRHRRHRHQTAESCRQEPVEFPLHRLPHRRHPASFSKKNTTSRRHRLNSNRMQMVEASEYTTLSADLTVASVCLTVHRPRRHHRPAIAQWIRPDPIPSWPIPSWKSKANSTWQTVSTINSIESWLLQGRRWVSSLRQKEGIIHRPHRHPPQSRSKTVSVQYLTILSFFN